MWGAVRETVVVEGTCCSYKGCEFFSQPQVRQLTSTPHTDSVVHRTKYNGKKSCKKETITRQGRCLCQTEQSLIVGIG